MTRTMLEDREGNVWVGTASGLDRFRPTNLHALAASDERVGRPCPGAGGEWRHLDRIGFAVFLGSSLDGVWKFDGRLRRISVPGNTSVTAVDVDAEGKLWIAGPEGVWREEGDERFRKVDELPAGARGQDVHALKIDLEGSPWISVVRSSLFRHRHDTWELNGNLAALPEQRPNALARDHEGRLWLGYGDGRLARVDSDRVKLFGVAEGLDLGKIFAIHVGTHTIVSGVNRIAVLDKGRFHVVTAPADPTVLEGVTGILESKSGDLWLSGLKGAVHVTAADFERAVHDRTYELRFELFDAEDGFPGMAQSVRPLPTIIEGKRRPSLVCRDTERRVSGSGEHPAQHDPAPCGNPCVHRRRTRILDDGRSLPPGGYT